MSRMSDLDITRQLHAEKYSEAELVQLQEDGLRLRYWLSISPHWNARCDEFRALIDQAREMKRN